MHLGSARHHPAGWAVAAVAALGLLVGVGCREDAAPEPAPATGPVRGGTIVIGSTADVDSWNEYRSRQSLAVNLLRRMYLRLARENSDGQVAPRSYAPLLAESWSFSDDQRSLTFKLRDALWSDGTPITARDVRFTWLAQVNEQVAWGAKQHKDHIEDVVVEDDRTVVFRFSRVYPFQFADAIEGGILPEHVFGQVPFEEWLHHDWSAVSIASGPFVLESHRPQQEIVLVRNPRYFDPEGPFADRVVIRIVPDATNLLTQLRAGEIDYMEGITPRDADLLQNDADIGVIPFDYSYDFIGWNGGRAPFDDPRVRRALTMAIDRASLVEDLLYGYGGISTGPVLSSWWGAAREIEAWPHDPAEARRLLADVAPLELEIITNSGNRLREQMLVKIQNQLEQAGVKARIQIVDSGTMRSRVFSGDYDGYLGGWTFSGKVDLENLFGSRFAPPKGFNIVLYASPPVDALLERLPGAQSWDEMKPILDGIQQAIHEDQPYSFLYEAKRLAAHGPRIHGVEIDIPSDSLAHLEDYWVTPR